MKTFWIYLSIFLALLIAIQGFLYFSSNDQYSINYKQLGVHLIITVACATIISFILRKRKNEYNEKANS